MKKKETKMVLRKGKLWRVCNKCGKSYCPSGISSKLCDKCNPSSQSKTMKRWIKRQRKDECLRCGNLKCKNSKICTKCYHSNRNRGSKKSSRWWRR